VEYCAALVTLDPGSGPTVGLVAELPVDPLDQEEDGGM